ncbi:MAG: MBL fold metallo-hydrolase [Rhizobacter sp.]|nr:MBL fold metallo-hydrolase [Chlorobiales bacterium]
MQQKVFGAAPQGERLARLSRSPHFENGIFKNISPTGMMRKDASYFKLLTDFLNTPETNTPPKTLPSVKVDLSAIASEKPVVVWFGHSSYLIKAGGFTVLVDPVFSRYASPVSFYGKAYDGADAYSADDMPDLDMVIITHDHYDHLDYETVLKLNAKTKHFYTALGVGAHLEAWDIDSSKITELDWWETIAVSDAVQLTATPARHFSGRKLTQFETLWASFVLKLPECQIYIGGDSGYDTHFKEIGEKFGAFDIAFLECGQYGEDWPFIHSFPEETAQAARDLNAKILMPVHWAKFSLAFHTWNEPIERLLKQAKALKVEVATPRIGEPFSLDETYPKTIWWRF